MQSSVMPMCKASRMLNRLVQYHESFHHKLRMSLCYLVILLHLQTTMGCQHKLSPLAVELCSNSPVDNLLFIATDGKSSKLLLLRNDGTSEVLIESRGILENPLYVAQSRSVYVRESFNGDAILKEYGFANNALVKHKTSYSLPVAIHAVPGQAYFLSSGKSRDYALGGSISTGFKLVLIQLPSLEPVLECPREFDFVNSVVPISHDEALIIGRTGPEHRINYEMHLWNLKSNKVSSKKLEYPVYNAVLVHGKLYFLSRALETQPNGDHEYALFSVDTTYNVDLQKPIARFGYVFSIATLEGRRVAVARGIHTQLDEIVVFNPELKDAQSASFGIDKMNAAFAE